MLKFLIESLSIKKKASDVPVLKELPQPATRSPPTENVPVLKWLPPPAIQSFPTNYCQLLCNDCILTKEELDELYSDLETINYNNDININDLHDLKTVDYNDVSINDLNDTVSNIKKKKTCR